MSLHVYHIEDLYKIVGRDDKVAVVDFVEGSEDYTQYGPTITVVFIYSLFERETLEKKFQQGTLNQTHGKAKVKFLSGAKLVEEQIEKLQKDGVNSKDIKSLVSGWTHENVFYEKKIRSIKTLEIPMQRKAKGGDYNWMYGFKKKLIQDGIGLHPYEREWYLAMKIFFEENELTNDELNEMNDDGVLKPEIELKYLEIKLEKEIISPEEEKKYETLLHDFGTSNFKTLKKQINSAGLSLKNLAKQKPNLFRFLIKGVTRYIPERLNISGKKAIYLDWDGFLHVFLRHVKEFEIGEQSKQKTKFSWTPDKITMVMENVIQSVDKEIQEYMKNNPGKRFDKYADGSLYFEGDYYTFHIEPDGRLSTFHMTNKKI
jgi:hypothetical protein